LEGNVFFLFFFSIISKRVYFAGEKKTGCGNRKVWIQGQDHSRLTKSMQPHADGSGGSSGAKRPPHVLTALCLDRRLAAASALEGGASRVRPAKSTGYRADLLQEPEKKKDTTLSDVCKRLVAGGIAGAIAKTAIAPLDRTKIIFQTHPEKKFSLRAVTLELVRFLAAAAPSPCRNPSSALPHQYILPACRQDAFFLSHPRAFRHACARPRCGETQVWHGGLGSATGRLHGSLRTHSIYREHTLSIETTF
jgi:hypothetical protein